MRSPLERIADSVVVTLAGPIAEGRVAGKGPRYVLAVHEAAHAVVARRLDLGVVLATVVPQVHVCGSQSAGMVVLGDPVADDLQTLARKLRNPSFSDRRLAVMGAQWSLPIEPPATWRDVLRRVREFRARAEREVSRHWVAIEALAVELLWEKTLGAKEIDAVLARVSVEGAGGWPSS